MNILITGASGFVGSWLAEYFLARENVEVFGTVRSTMRSDLTNIGNARMHPRFHLLNLDVTSYQAVQNVLVESQPDRIYNLAAITFVPDSFKDPMIVWDVNTGGVLNILEGVRRSHYDPVILNAGSSEQFGLTYPSENPLNESSPSRPASTYGMSKVAAEGLLGQYHLSFGMKTVLTRTFNHDGPRRGKDTLMSNVTRQIVGIERGLADPIIYHGLIDSVRDYTHINDVVRAYDLALYKCHYGTPYVIGSGQGHSAGELIDLLISKSKVKGIKKVHDPSRDRPSDIPLMLADSKKFRNATGWRPEVPFSQIPDDLLTYWREKFEIPASSVPLPSFPVTTTK